MEKRVLIAFLLSFAVLYGVRFLMPTPPPPAKPPVEAKVEPAEAPAVSTPTPVADEQIVLQAESEEFKRVETALFVAEVSNIGGVLKSFQLKQYTDAMGKPTDLVDSYAGARLATLWQLLRQIAALNKILSEAKFVMTQEGSKVNLEYRAGGIHARKAFDFDQEKYRAVISTELERNGVSVPHEVVLQGEFGDQSLKDVAINRNAIYQILGKFERINVGGIEEPQDVTAISGRRRRSVFPGDVYSGQGRPDQSQQAGLQVA